MHQVNISERADHKDDDDDDIDTDSWLLMAYRAEILQREHLATRRTVQPDAEQPIGNETIVAKRPQLWFTTTDSIDATRLQITGQRAFGGPHTNRVVLLGDTGVGKTQIAKAFDRLSVLCRLTRSSASVATTSNDNAQFDQVHTATVGVEFSRKILIDRDGNLVPIQLWDTAGQERYMSLLNSYLRSAVVCLMVYDVCDRKTWNDLWETWIPKVERDTRDAEHKPYLVVVGNKVDCSDEKIAVRFDEAHRVCHEKMVSHIETSAKQLHQIDLLFSMVATFLTDGFGKNWVLDVDPVDGEDPGFIIHEEKLNTAVAGKLASDGAKSPHALTSGVRTVATIRLPNKLMYKVAHPVDHNKIPPHYSTNLGGYEFGDSAGSSPTVCSC